MSPFGYKKIKQPKSRRHFSKAFTLVEIAIVLVIIGIGLGGLLLTLSAQIDLRNYAATRQAMEEIKEALIGYSLAHGYLPCPAKSATDGTEDRNTASGDCNNRAGFLPWQELSVVRNDNWNHLYRYSVTNAYSRSTDTINLSPTTARDITIRTRNSSGNLVNLSNANDIPAVIISHGKNGFGATSIDGVLVADSSVNNDDENTNAMGTVSFVSRDYSEVKNTTFSEYDDIVVWLSPNIYLSKLVAVGRLP